MIELTRLNGQPMVVNSDLIKYAESSPDTALTLINGEKIVVSEPCEEVVRRVTAYRSRLLTAVLRQAGSDGLTSLAVASGGASAMSVLGASQYPNDEIPDGREESVQQRRHRSE
jgi:flagellar protein FlbD